MNFLSHFYFDKHSDDEYLVLGTVLPDLLKNALKESNIHPKKFRHLFFNDPLQNSILTGWERHILVDKIFHSSVFFKEQTAELKQLILPLVHDSPVKPFFLAHIGLELILDHLITIHRRIEVDKFYYHLGEIDKQVVRMFLENCRLGGVEDFFVFLDGFISARYLVSYSKIENITYALNRICMRLWDTPFNDQQIDKLTTQLILFKQTLEMKYLNVFDEIEFNLNIKGV